MPPRHYSAARKQDAILYTSATHSSVITPRHKEHARCARHTQQRCAARARRAPARASARHARRAARALRAHIYATPSARTPRHTHMRTHASHAATYASNTRRHIRMRVVYATPCRAHARLYAHKTSLMAYLMIRAICWRENARAGGARVAAPRHTHYAARPSSRARARDGAACRRARV